MSLYQILTEYLSLENEAATDEEFQATLEALKIAGREECIEFAKVIKNKETLIKTIIDEVDRLEERNRKLKQQCLAMKKRLLPYVKKFSNTGIIDTPSVTIKVNIGRGRVEITNEEDIPDEFMRFKKEPDKAKIHTWIASGETVEGAEIVREETLSVK